MSSIYRLADAAADMAACGTSVLHIGCFRACLDPSSDLAALNYAVPWVSPWTYEQARLAVLRLREVFAGHQRTLRISLPRQAWPWLAPLLESADFTAESEIDLMVCTRETFHTVPSRDVSIVDALDPAPFAAIQAEVFPEEPNEPALVSYQIAQGFWRCAVAYEEDAPVAAGSLVPQGRIAELAAMATLPHYRRQGYGSAIASLLVQTHFNSGGDLVWLAVSNPAAASVYEKIGFRPAGSRVTFAEKSTPA